MDGSSVTVRVTECEGAERREFQAEVNRLLGVFINSLYTGRQVFLRELETNAAAALGKARSHTT